MVNYLNENSFNAKVGADGTKVVQFTADWCGPCKMLTPRLESLSDRYDFEYYKVDVDDSSELARQFQIMSIPTVFVYKNGRMKNRFTGVKSEQELAQELGLDSSAQAV